MPCFILGAIFILPDANMTVTSIWCYDNFSHSYKLWVKTVTIEYSEREQFFSLFLHEVSSHAHFNFFYTSV